MIEKNWYHTEDHHSPNLSKASLGDFLYRVLKEGGEISQIWPFNPRYDRSPVYFVVKLTEEAKLKIEKETKIRFKLPREIHLN